MAPRKLNKRRDSPAPETSILEKSNRRVPISSDSESDSARGDETQEENASENVAAEEDASESGSDNAEDDSVSQQEVENQDEQSESDEENANETSSSSGDEAEDEQPPRRKPKLKWSDAGLTFPVSSIHRRGKYLTGMKIDREHVTGEVAQLAWQRALADNKKRITPRHLMEAIKGDRDLSSIKPWRNATLRGTGVLSKGIHPALLPPLRPARRVVKAKHDENQQGPKEPSKARKRVAQGSNQPGTSGTYKTPVKKRKILPLPGTDSSDDD